MTDNAEPLKVDYDVMQSDQLWQLIGAFNDRIRSDTAVRDEIMMALMRRHVDVRKGPRAPSDASNPFPGAF